MWHMVGKNEKSSLGQELRYSGNNAHRAIIQCLQDIHTISSLPHSYSQYMMNKTK